MASRSSASSECGSGGSEESEAGLLARAPGGNATASIVASRSDEEGVLRAAPIHAALDRLRSGLQQLTFDAWHHHEPVLLKDRLVLHDGIHLFDPLATHHEPLARYGTATASPGTHKKKERNKHNAEHDLYLFRAWGN